MQRAGKAGPLCTLVTAPLVPKYLLLCQHTDTGHTDALPERALSGQESSRRSGHSDTGSMAETPAMSTIVTGDAGAVASGGSSLHWTDYLVIVGYFLSVIVVSSFGMRLNKVSRYFQSSFIIQCFKVGLVSSFKSKRDSVDGYFLASRSMNWIPVITIGQQNSSCQLNFVICFSLNLNQRYVLILHGK